MVTHGTISLFVVIGIAFFMSIMFPTIFSLGIKDLGKDTKFGSSLIIMSIVGGAILPPAMGYVADIADIQIGYIVPLICFAVVFLFGVTGHKVVKRT
jgi:FHS family L-fucose permease-like MFS transporter